MAASKSQRIAIWIIAGAMLVGTLGSFAVMILGNKNSQIDQAAQEKMLKEYEAQQKQAAQENADSSEGFGGHVAAAFDGAAVTALSTEVLTEGDGEVIKDTDSINASYFGWTADGKIFDSSKKKGVDDKPVTFPLSGVIKGWTQGLTGQKVGSTVRLTIPADLGYGAQGSGVIAANAPLMFIVNIHKIDNTAVN